MLLFPINNWDSYQELKTPVSPYNTSIPLIFKMLLLLHFCSLIHYLLCNIQWRNGSKLFNNSLKDWLFGHVFQHVINSTFQGYAWWSLFFAFTPQISWDSTWSREPGHATCCFLEKHYKFRTSSMVLSWAAYSGKRNCEISHFQNLPSVDYITIPLQQKERSVNQVTRAQESNL